MGDGNSFPLVVCVFQVILVYESIVLCMCSGKYIDIYFIMKITFALNLGSFIYRICPPTLRTPLSDLSWSRLLRLRMLSLRNQTLLVCWMRLTLPSVCVPSRPWSMWLLVVLPPPLVVVGLVFGVLQVVLRLLATAAVSWVCLLALRSVSASTPLLQLPL